MSGDKSTGKDDRYRNWSFILYPDSAPKNWAQKLDDLHLQWIESPLHEFDTNPTGEIKKAHKHIALLFEGKKSYEQILEITKELNSPIPQRIQSVKGAIRYMAHLDNPEKFQYPMSEIKAHGGIDIADLLCPTKTERYSAIKEMIKYCRDNNITEFQDLMDYASETRFDSWFPLLCDNSAYVIGQYIKSQRHRNEHKSYSSSYMDCTRAGAEAEEFRQELEDN